MTIFLGDNFIVFVNSDNGFISEIEKWNFWDFVICCLTVSKIVWSSELVLLWS